MTAQPAMREPGQAKQNAPGPGPGAQDHPAPSTEVPPHPPHRKGPLRPSTREFMAGFRDAPGAGLWTRLHGYLYAAFPYLYIGVGTGEHRLTRPITALFNLIDWVGARLGRSSQDGQAAAAFADTYHGKVVPLGEAKNLVTINRNIDLGDLEQVIPYTLAREVVLKNPDHIVALDCPCRVARPNPCLPLGVCLIVGEPFASFVADHHPGRTRWISQAEAVSILQEEEERGHVHHAFFKDAMLGRFYAICNCCSCCCGAMQAQRNGVPMLASSGYVSQVDGDACVGCGACEDRCQFGAISLVDGVAVVDGEACMGCGACASACAAGAAELVRDPAKGEPLMIRELIHRHEAGEEPSAPDRA